MNSGSVSFRMNAKQDQSLAFSIWVEKKWRCSVKLDRFFSLLNRKKQQKNINRLASLMATKNKNKCMQSVLEHYWESDNWLARISVAYIYKHNWKDNWWQWNECQHITIFHHRTSLFKPNSSFPLECFKKYSTNFIEFQSKINSFDRMKNEFLKINKHLFISKF